VRRYNILAGFIWLGLSIYILVESLQIGLGGFRSPDAGLFPILTALPLGIFSLLLIFDAALRKEDPKEEPRKVWAKETKWKNLILAFLALVAYALLVDPLGYVLTTFLFVLLLFRLIEPQSWAVSVLAALATALVTFVVFNLWLNTQLPEGMIFPWLKGIF
jgi:putative tricarboxylic transport membrane protein